MTTDTATLIREHLVAEQISFEEVIGADQAPTFVIELPGVHKQKTNCALTVGRHALTINAFVARHPDENHAGVHEWLLERNRRMYAVAFSIDQFGDIYLTGKMPLTAINGDELDRILGAVLEYADNSFNIILELGFATAIRREWDWRIKNGESTENLRAFEHLAARSEQSEQPSGD